jgi:hypothetical protein
MSQLFARLPSVIWVFICINKQIFSVEDNSMQLQVQQEKLPICRRKKLTDKKTQRHTTSDYVVKCTTKNSKLLCICRTPLAIKVWVPFDINLVELCVSATDPGTDTYAQWTPELGARHIPILNILNLLYHRIMCVVLFTYHRVHKIKLIILIWHIISIKMYKLI